MTDSSEISLSQRARALRQQARLSARGGASFGASIAEARRTVHDLADLVVDMAELLDHLRAEDAKR